MRHPRKHNNDRNHAGGRSFLTCNAQPNDVTAICLLFDVRCGELRIQRPAGDFGNGRICNGRVEGLDDRCGSARAEPCAKEDESPYVLDGNGAAGAVAKIAHRVRPTQSATLVRDYAAKPELVPRYATV